MPAENQDDQDVGTISGDNEEVGTPQHEVTELRGVPDIVSFSDTSFIVFRERHDVYLAWNMPVTGFGRGSIYFFWYNKDGSPDTTNVGNVVVLAIDGSNTGVISIDFPEGRAGSLNVQIFERSVVSALDNKTLGPPGPRGFFIEYDRESTITVPDGQADLTPATLRLSRPHGSLWRQDSYNQRFTWSKSTTGFDAEDVDVSIVSGSGTATKGELDKTNEDNRVYSMPINFRGSGRVRVRVMANVAKSGGSAEDNSPQRMEETEWDFDANLDPTAFTISGVTILCNETYQITNHPELETPADGGCFLGVSDLAVVNNRVYFTSQIQKKRPHIDEVSTFAASSGALVSVPIGGGTCQIHKKYPFFRKAARSLVSHRDEAFQNELYFFEGSSYIYDGSAQPNYTLKNLGEGLGFIRRINASGVITTLGLNWRSAFPTGEEDKYVGVHGGTMCPMISHEGDLHIISERYDKNDINGIQWIVHGKRLNQRVSLLETNGKTGFEVLEELAILNNSIMSLAQGNFEFKPRKQTQAFVANAFDESEAAVIDYNFANRVYPFNSGSLLKIDNEIISYDGLGVTSFADLTRGLAGTTPAPHARRVPVVLVDHIINATDFSEYGASAINELTIDTDGTTVYNSVLVRYAHDQVPRVNALSFIASDEDSIAQYGEQKFGRRDRDAGLDLALDYHQGKWAAMIAQDTINRHKGLQKLMTLVLKRNFDIKASHIVYIREPILSNTYALCQVMSVNHSKDTEETELIVITITPDELPDS